jgi:hypothetical protein
MWDLKLRLGSDQSSDMISFVSLLTIFKMSIIVGIENWLLKKPCHATISKFNDDKFVLILISVVTIRIYGPSLRLLPRSFRPVPLVQNNNPLCKLIITLFD